MSINQAQQERTDALRATDRRCGTRSVIEAAKEVVPTIDLADRLCGPCQMRRLGEKWTARCPLPDHEDRSPSFVVYPGDGGWWCFGCQRGGDVVDLARLAWGIDRADVAAAEVLMTFGHPIPPRPEAWFRRQERQAPVRQALAESKARMVQRRLYRWFYAPRIALFEDEAERLEETRIAWEECALLARLMMEGR